ncbi:hypothetical protein BGZ96_007804 [Linnemannia gamsii]|uniref:RNI-like protein n=1 Tax=Linnemannia gamsii TaxID=64522 RepID=A0ABQ7K037_9FUNG|nr:hypothetical protein BGZ96_007804 [Linnemannia gamsii]
MLQDAIRSQIKGLSRTGVLTEDCLILLAERCTDLEWLNLARASPGLLDTSPESEADNGGVIDNHAEAVSEIEQEEEEEVEEEKELEVDNEKISVTSDMDSDQLIQEESTTENEKQHHQEQEQEQPVMEDSITDRALALLCESCPKLQLLDLSYISTISNSAMESLSETAKSLVCLTIIGCPGITSQSLLYLARLRNNSGKLGCITMGDALGISERDIEQIMQGTLSGWQKSLVDETNLGEILGRSWDE